MRIAPPRARAAGAVTALLAAGAVMLPALFAALCFMSRWRGARAIDDAFILMVYVRHLLERGDLFWNAGDGRLDGFTSMLDLLVKSAAVRVSGADIVRATYRVTLGTHVAVAVLAAGLVGTWARRAGHGARAALLAGTAGGVVIGTTPALGEASSFLLEGPLYVLCGLSLIGLLVTCERWTRGAQALLVGLCFLTLLARPEGIALAAGALAVLVWRGGPSWRARLGTAAAFFALATAYYAWHIHIFGRWAPNTYYAKRSDVLANELTDGLWYVRVYGGKLSGVLGYLPLLMAPAALASRGWRTREDRIGFAVVVAAAAGLLGVVVFEGGDCYAGGRLLCLPVVLGLLALFRGAIGSGGRLRAGLLTLVGAAAVWHLHGSLKHLPTIVAFARPRLALNSDLYTCERELAARLGQVIPGGTFAESDFQRLKFFADDLRVIDIFGLNDREIALAPRSAPVRWGKDDLALVLRRRPDAWVWGPGYMRDVPLDGATLFPLRERPELAPQFADYVPASTRVCGDVFMSFLVRSDLAPRFAAAGFALRPWYAGPAIRSDRVFAGAAELCDGSLPEVDPRARKEATCQGRPVDPELLRYPRDGAVLRAGFVPHRARAVLGEPVFIAFVLRNDGPGSVQIHPPGYRTEGTRRSARFDVRAVGPGGAPVPDADPSMELDTMGEAELTIAAGQTYVEDLVLPEWALLDRPGSYTITATRRVMGWDTTATGAEMRSTFTVEVRSPDPARMANVIAELGREVRARDRGERWTHVRSLDRALRGLIAIDDAAVVPFLGEMLRDPREHRILILAGLRRFNVPERRRLAIEALADPQAWIRAEAASVLGRMPSAESVAALRQALADAEAEVREAASQSLRVIGPR